MPRRDTRCWGSPVMSLPLNHTRPEEGAISPDTRRKKVVLPAPFGPMIERSSPRRTVKSTRSTARRLPKARVSRSVRRRMESAPAVMATRAMMSSRLGLVNLATVVGARGIPPAPPGASAGPPARARASGRGEELRVADLQQMLRHPRESGSEDLVALAELELVGGLLQLRPRQETLLGQEL